MFFLLLQRFIFSIFKLLRNWRWSSRFWNTLSRCFVKNSSRKRAWLDFFFLCLLSRRLLYSRSLIRQLLRNRRRNWFLISFLIRCCQPRCVNFLGCCWLSRCCRLSWSLIYNRPWLCYRSGLLIHYRPRDLRLNRSLSLNRLLLFFN